MLFEELNKRLALCNRIIKDAELTIKKSPRGKLKTNIVHRKNGDAFQYYHREDSSELDGRYLSKDEMGLARNLAQKEYCEKVLSAAKKEKKEIEKICEKFSKDTLLEAYTEMKKGKRILVEPYVLPDEEYARRWQAKKYEGGKFEDGDSVQYTKRGDRVRSKSEQIIADRLYDAKIPYRYEYPLEYVKGKYIYTDFTVLNPKTRRIYRWEHFGRMDDDNYRKTFFWKQSVYMSCGYVPGVNYICTFEDNENPLDVRVVDKIIEKILS
ncbi:MAG: hypothetical protein J6U27_05265 [Spirochaetales bacterium]|nr:hypothetical protein [Spirochaetales bacterium]